MGTLFPPLGAYPICVSAAFPQILTSLVFPAVATRFGIGGDFWLNLVLTIAGYIPGVSMSQMGS